MMLVARQFQFICFVTLSFAFILGVGLIAWSPISMGLVSTAKSSEESSAQILTRSALKVSIYNEIHEAKEEIKDLTYFSGYYFNFSRYSNSIYFHSNILES